MGKRRRKRGSKTLMHKRNIDQLALAHAPAGNQTHNPGICPDRELN